MENIIKQIIDIEDSAKKQLAEIEDVKIKHNENCSLELQQMKKLKYLNIDKKMNEYKKEQNLILDSNITMINNKQQKINDKLIYDFNLNYNTKIKELLNRITR